MELRPVEYVCAVVDHGSFTRAAAALDVAQPSLSEGVHRLERELGVHLFERAGRTVRLTATGEALLGPARQLLRDRDAAIEAVAAVRELRSGTLDLVALPTLVAEPLAGLIGRFRSTAPRACPCTSPTPRTTPRSKPARRGRSERARPHRASATRRLVRHVAARTAGDRGGVSAGYPTRPRRSAPGRGAGAAAVDHHAAGASTRDLLDRALASARVTAKESGREHSKPRPSVRWCWTAPAVFALLLGVSRAGRGAGLAGYGAGGARTIGLLHRTVSLSPAARAFVEMARPARPTRPVRHSSVIATRR